MSTLPALAVDVAVAVAWRRWFFVPCKLNALLAFFEDRRAYFVLVAFQLTARNSLCKLAHLSYFFKSFTCATSFFLFTLCAVSD